MKVLFIDPPGIDSPQKNQPGTGLNLAIATLSAVLLRCGHKVSLFDMANHYENRSIDFIRNSLDCFTPDVIGVSILNAQYMNAVKVIKRLREYTDIPIIVGGAEVTAIKEKIFHDTEFAIYISVLGEGEESLIEILQCLEKNDPNSMENIKGLIINKNGELINTGPPQRVKNLNDYPYPEMEIFGVKKLKLYKILGSRGCPFKCLFCFSYLGRTWRNKTPTNIINELQTEKKKYDFSRFRFLDPNFNFRKIWVHEICDAIKASSLFGMPWEALGVRADKIDDELCKHMVDAGCERVAIGVESLHPEVFKHINKGETIDQIKNGVTIAAKYFKKVSIFMIIGLPGDNMERSIYTYNQAKKLNPTNIAYAIAVPYSGTRLDKWVQGNATLLGDSYDSFTRGSDAFESGVAFETSDFSKEERLQTFRILNTKEFRYVSKSRKHRYLDPIFWLRDAATYDASNFHRHLFHVTGNILGRLKSRLSTSVSKAKSPSAVQYNRIPDGTWWLG